MSYQCLSLDGNGYASIADGFQVGLDVGLSDFMVEVRIRTTAVGKYILMKYQGGFIGYRWGIGATGELQTEAGNGGAWDLNLNSALAVNTGRWCYIVLVVDRSGTCYHFIDGVADANTTMTNYDNWSSTQAFDVGNCWWNVDYRFVGDIDEVRIWNFGYDGLPADYAAYIAWRAQDRNWFRDVSEYSLGAWSDYTDADRVERITYGVLDDDNGDFEGAGPDATDISINTDWSKISVSAEIDDEAGSGVNTYNGSNFCCKIHTALLGSARIVLQGVNFDAVFTIGEYYEISFEYKVLNCTSAKMQIVNAGAATDQSIALTSAVWIPGRLSFRVLNNTDFVLRIYVDSVGGVVGNEVVWVDNISIKKVGLVAHWKFNEDYLDEGSNNNDLTAGGTGNIFPTYSLKQEKIILAGVVNPAMGARR